MTPAQALDFASVFVFALTGALAASRAQLDIIGFLFLASLTAVGGGTVRDVILGRDQVFWVAQPAYVGVACVAAILVFFTAHLLESRLRAILWLDAVALSVAVTAGFAVARSLDASWPVRNSSITTSRPLSPNWPPSSMPRTACSAAAAASQISTPLPAARPLALTTTGRRQPPR